MEKKTEFIHGSGLSALTKVISGMSVTSAIRIGAVL